MTDYETLSKIADDILDEADDDIDRLVDLLSLQDGAVLNELLDSDLLNAYQVFYYYFRREPSELIQDILMLEPATSLRYGVHIDDSELAEVVADTRDDTSGLAELLNAFLSGLPDDTRFIFMRRYNYADDIPAIAKMTGLSKNGVSARLMRARKKLAEQLKEKGYKI